MSPAAERWLLPALLLSLAGCDSSAPGPTNGAGEDSLKLIAREGDAARPIRIRTGERFGIALEGNASIGYVWSVAAVPANLRDEGFLYSGEPDPVPGASTGKVFRFTGIRPGQGTLRFALSYRDQPNRMLDFDVSVD